jgi:glycosyltransferase involved in cell wall biosynthesis
MNSGNEAGRKRILFLTPQVPYPPQQGTALRNYNLISQVARFHDPALLTFAEPQGEATEGGPLADICRPLEMVPQPVRTLRDRWATMITSGLPDMAARLYDPAFEQALVRLLTAERFDILQVEGIELARYALRLAPLIRERGTAIVFDDHNAEYALQRRACITDLGSPKRWPAALYSLLQWRRLQSFEHDICVLADGVVAVSSEDRAALMRIAAGVEPLVLPNGVDVECYRPGQPDSLPLEHPALVFTGKMDYRPNVDAVTWFHRRIWPAIRRRHPAARFYVVGKGDHPALAPLRGDPSVTVTGFVADILPYFAGADVYVAPLRMGSGTRLKLLEAMASGLPIVSTRIGAEGLSIVAGQHCLLADDPARFASACSQLLLDAEQRHALGDAARQFAVERYDWRRLVPQLDLLYAPLGEQTIAGRDALMPK